MLLEEFDREIDAVINPEMCVERIENFPEVTISCFSWNLFDSVLEAFDAKKIADLHSATGLNPVYEVEYKGKRFALFHSLVGEPICVAQYEEVMAMGSKRLILLGNCGVLDKTIEDCGIIIPTAAIRDEGTSFHYAEPGNVIEVNKKYRDTFKNVLADCGYSYVEGMTWTTDACYRETREKVNRKEQSVLKWNAPECRRYAISEERNSFNTFMPATILIILPGIRGASRAVRALMIRRK